MTSDLAEMDKGISGGSGGRHHRAAGASDCSRSIEIELAASTGTSMCLVHPDSPTALADLAYEHAVRGLDSQVEVIADNRSRANALILASGAVATLFSGLVLKENGATHFEKALVIVPLILFVATALYAVAVWKPTGKRGQEGKLELVAGAAAILEMDAGDEPAKAVVAKGLEEMWDKNQSLIEEEMNSLRRATWCVGGQIVCWALLLTAIEVSP